MQKVTLQFNTISRFCFDLSNGFGKQFPLPSLLGKTELSRLRRGTERSWFTLCEAIARLSWLLSLQGSLPTVPVPSLWWPGPSTHQHPMHTPDGHRAPPLHPPGGKLLSAPAHPGTVRSLLLLVSWCLLITSLL